MSRKQHARVHRERHDNGGYVCRPWTSSVAWSLFGADGDHFSINREGDLSFVAPPDYDDPADADAGNVYRVDVHASDGSATGFLAVSVTVTDLNEPARCLRPGRRRRRGGLGHIGGGLHLRRPGRWRRRGGRLPGSDHQHFTVTNGELHFREAPDFESPADANGNNRYEVTVLAEDGGDLPREAPRDRLRDRRQRGALDRRTGGHGHSHREPRARVPHRIDRPIRRQPGARPHQSRPAGRRESTRTATR